METAWYATQTHPTRLIPENSEIWIGCPSFELQEEGTQKKLLQYLPSDAIAHKENIRANVIKSLRLKNGIKITFKSYEQGREKWQSAGKRLIWFDEEPPHDIWEEALVRQEAGVPLDIILTMTPVNGMTWVYDELFMNTDNSDLFVSTAGWADNPYLLKEQLEQMERGLSAEALQVRRYGRFISRVGLVCGWWMRDKHLREYSEFDNSWSYYEVFDGGYSDPSAWLLIGIDNDGNVHVLDGYREVGLNADQIVEKRNNRIAGLVVRGGYCDSDNPRLNQDMGLLGMVLRPVEKMAGEGSWDEALAEKLSEYGQLQKLTGEPKLYINQSLTWLIQEIENLKWLEQKKKQGVETIPKWDDHRRFKHHFDGSRALAYFLIMFNKKDTGSEHIAILRNTRAKKKWSLR